jgi:CRP-like cAMP-binding protein
MPPLPVSPSSDRGRARRLLAKSRFFRDVDDDLLDRLSARTSMLTFARGERVWARGTPVEHFHQIVRGVLELRRASGGHDATLVALFGPGEHPAVPVALERGRFIADAHAATDVLEVLRVPAGPVLEQLPHDARLAAGAERVLLDHVRLLHAKIDVLTAGTIAARIALFLIDLAERFGDERDDGSTAIPLSLSRAQIAGYVDARVETVIRCFSAWRREGLVVVEPGATVIPSLARMREVLRD